MALKQSLRGAISPFIVMDVMRAANARETEGKAVYHLEVGQPGTPAPRKVREAAAKALESDLIGYTNAMGIDPLREAIAGHYKTKFGVSVDPAACVLRVDHPRSLCWRFLLPLTRAIGLPWQPRVIRPITTF